MTAGKAERLEDIPGGAVQRPRGGLQGLVGALHSGTKGVGRTAGERADGLVDRADESASANHVVAATASVTTGLALRATRGAAGLASAGGAAAAAGITTSVGHSSNGEDFYRGSKAGNLKTFTNPFYPISTTPSQPHPTDPSVRSAPCC